MAFAARTMTYRRLSTLLAITTITVAVAVEQASVETCAADDKACAVEEVARFSAEEAEEETNSLNIQLLQKSLVSRASENSAVSGNPDDDTRLDKSVEKKSNEPATDAEYAANLCPSGYGFSHTGYWSNSYGLRAPFGKTVMRGATARQCGEACNRLHGCVAFNLYKFEDCWLYDSMAQRKDTKSTSIACMKGARAAPSGAPSPGNYHNHGGRNIRKAYHQTSPDVCRLILNSAFRVGKGGLCGKAIYFALSPEATSGKAITKYSEGGCMIEAEVDVGHSGRYYAQDDAPARWIDGQKEKPCGSYSSMNAGKMAANGDDTITMRRGDGDELIVFDPNRIVNMKMMNFKCEWMCKGACQKHWPSYCHKR